MLRVSPVPAAKRRRARHWRSAALFWLYLTGVGVVALVAFDMMGQS